MARRQQSEASFSGVEVEDLPPTANPASVSLSSVKCKFCEFENPEDASWCSRCQLPLCVQRIVEKSIHVEGKERRCLFPEKLGSDPNLVIIMADCIEKSRSLLFDLHSAMSANQLSTKIVSVQGIEDTQLSYRIGSTWSIISHVKKEFQSKDLLGIIACGNLSTRDVCGVMDNDGALSETVICDGEITDEDLKSAKVQKMEIKSENLGLIFNKIFKSKSKGGGKKKSKSKVRKNSKGRRPTKSSETGKKISTRTKRSKKTSTKTKKEKKSTGTTYDTTLLETGVPPLPSQDTGDETSKIQPKEREELWKAYRKLQITPILQNDNKEAPKDEKSDENVERKRVNSEEIPSILLESIDFSGQPSGNEMEEYERYYNDNVLQPNSARTLSARTRTRQGRSPSRSPSRRREGNNGDSCSSSSGGKSIALPPNKGQSFEEQTQAPNPIFITTAPTDEDAIEGFNKPEEEEKGGEEEQGAMNGITFSRQSTASQGTFTIPINHRVTTKNFLETEELDTRRSDTSQNCTSQRSDMVKIDSRCSSARSRDMRPAKSKRGIQNDDNVEVSMKSNPTRRSVVIRYDKGKIVISESNDDHEEDGKQHLNASLVVARSLSTAKKDTANGDDEEVEEEGNAHKSNNEGKNQEEDQTDEDDDEMGSCIILQSGSYDVASSCIVKKDKHKKTVESGIDWLKVAKAGEKLPVAKRYKSVKRLGSGAFGNAYLVRNVESDSKTDLYVIKRIRVRNLSEINEALIEANNLSRLRGCKHICAFKEAFFDSKVNETTDSFSTDNLDFCIVMEYCSEGTLEDVIKSKNLVMRESRTVEAWAFEPTKIDWSFDRGGGVDTTSKTITISMRQILTYVKEIAMGLKVMHSHGVLHRDLKPANIFLDKNGNTKIGDFGISKALERENETTRTYIGTKLYMAPEVVMHKPYGTKCDIWGLGCVMLELVTMQVLYHRVVPEILEELDLKKYPRARDLLGMILQEEEEKRPTAAEVLSFLLFSSCS
mmetsp:Transcript_33011/g.53603  ORF Transcript_33011/g.53603 Transcript_33011/m.53603 type:complete len:998 (+) Transcript_33011:94-3087(+)